VVAWWEGGRGTSAKEGAQRMILTQIYSNMGGEEMQRTRSKESGGSRLYGGSMFRSKKDTDHVCWGLGGLGWSLGRKKPGNWQ